MASTFKEACRAILEKAAAGEIADARDLASAKIWACREFGLSKPPRNSDILAAASEKSKAVELLRLKPVRSISGVSVITVMPKPYPCPKEEPCIYCPGGPSYNTPQSYTGREPAAARALQHNYDPYGQVKSRIEQLRAIGHDVDKVELIIFGGTLTAYPRNYLEWFVTQCLNTMSGANVGTLKEAQQVAETAPIRVSDIALETRPDYCKEEHVDFMLELGATRVELGVQTIYDDIYQLVERGHSVDDVVEATRIARDAGFALTYHAMPNLFGSNYERDLNAFKMFFEDERFKPDALKIYPTLVMEGTKLHELWLRGKYKPYPFEKVVNLIAEVKKMVPKWVRIQRIQRDIPSNLIVDGVKRGDLRNLVQEKLRGQGAHCRCIRCREVGHVEYKVGLRPRTDDIELVVEKYPASEGEEIFLSYEDKKCDILVGLLRLRCPSEKAHRPEVRETSAMLVRELHVYGPLVPVYAKPKDEWQHKGYGAALLREAEKIAMERYDAKKIAVLAGIGTREYYLKQGYAKDGPYVSKRLI